MDAFLAKQACFLLFFFGNSVVVWVFHPHAGLPALCRSGGCLCSHVVFFLGGSSDRLVTISDLEAAITYLSKKMLAL